jgi:hypothetical protein
MNCEDDNLLLGLEPCRLIGRHRYAYSGESTRRQIPGYDIHRRETSNLSMNGGEKNNMEGVPFDGTNLAFTWRP